MGISKAIVRQRNQMNRNSFILLISCLILPLQVLACNCGCKHGSCGNSQNSCSQKATNQNTNNSCSGNSNSNNVSCMTEQKISSNNLYCNGNNYTCGGNKK